MNDEDRDLNAFSENEHDEVMEDAEELENERENDPTGNDEGEAELEEDTDPKAGKSIPAGDGGIIRGGAGSAVEASKNANGSTKENSAAADGTSVDFAGTMPKAADGEGAGGSASMTTAALPYPQDSSTPLPYSSLNPRVRPEATTAKIYDIVPTMAAPQATSINALAVTPDLRYWMTGGSDGYIRKYDGPGTINGKQLLTVAQRHPFVDSVVKSGILMSYWENEEPPTAVARGAEEHILSPVYSLAVHSRALWLLAGTEGGGINLQSVRHDEGKRITCLQRHSNAVSVLQLSPDEKSVLSGSWDKNIFDWDLNNGQVKRQFDGSGGQISTLELRSASGAPIPAHASDDELFKTSDATFASNNDKPLPNGMSVNNPGAATAVIGDASASAASATVNGDDPIPDHESLFGSPGGSLFGGSDAMGANPFGDDDLGTAVDITGESNVMVTDVSSFSQEVDMVLDGTGTSAGVLASDSAAPTTDTTATGSARFAGAPSGGADPEVTPAMPHLATSVDGIRDLGHSDTEVTAPVPDVTTSSPSTNVQSQQGLAPQLSNELLSTSQVQLSAEPVAAQLQIHGEEIDTTTTTGDTLSLLQPKRESFTPTQHDALVYSSQPGTMRHDPTQVSETTFFSASMDGTIRIWDRRQNLPVARIGNRIGVPPWCMGACWSPDGNRIYAGRRNGIVEEFDIHKAHSAWKPERSLKFPAGSGPVSAVRAMANGRHLVCASHDILRLYDLQDTSAVKGSSVPFLIIPGPPRAGVISHLYIDQTSRFMISTAGTRGWEGTNTEVLIGYEINSVQ